MTSKESLTNTWDEGVKTPFWEKSPGNNRVRDTFQQLRYTFKCCRVRTDVEQEQGNRIEFHELNINKFPEEPLAMQNPNI